MSLVNQRAVSNTLNVLMQNWSKTAILPSQGIKVGEESLGMHFGQCALYTRAGSREGRPCWVSTRNALHSTHRHMPPLLKPWWGFVTLDRQTGNEIPQKWPPATVGGKAFCCKGASPVPWCLNSAGQQQCPCLQGFPLCCWTRQRCCLAGLFHLHQRAAAAPAPHPDWSRVSGRPWHCHPEPLCKCQNYSKAPLWSLHNS